MKGAFTFRFPFVPPAGPTMQVEADGHPASCQRNDPLELLETEPGGPCYVAVVGHGEWSCNLAQALSLTSGT